MSRIEGDFGNERKSGIINIKPKYYIFSEGSVTEPQYFRKLNKSILSNQVEILNVLRDYAYSGNSNPSKIVRLVDNLLCCDQTKITIKEIKNKINNWGHESSIDVSAIIKKISSRYKESKSVTYGELKKIIISMFSGEIYEDFADNFLKYFEAQDFTYSEGIDKICIVADRDNKSFTKQQYFETADYCKKNNVGLFISNPCFEFWLLLHFKEVEYEDNSILLKNPKITSSKRYIEKRLQDLCGYNKKHLPFDQLGPNIKSAIKREKRYEENIAGLENKLGSNVGKLVDEMINKH